MKYWISHLPLEVWVDVFSFPLMSREELAEIVNKIGNYKFAEYLQFYLHDWGKQKLDRFKFDQVGLHKLLYYSPFSLHLAIPQTPVPMNIKYFNHISIDHFDAQTIAFLRQIGPILTNVNLELYFTSPEDVENLRAILTNLLPLLGGIHALSFFECALPTVKQCFGEKLAEIKVLGIIGPGFDVPGMVEAKEQATINFLLNWLTSPGQHGIGPPKFSDAQILYMNLVKISLEIREEFLAAKTQRTFALFVRPCYNGNERMELVEFHLENNIGEELHGVWIEQKYFQISRHQANCGPELQEWIEGIKVKFHRNRIEMWSPTIGLNDAVDAPENAEANDQKPSTSKEA